jgi:hypothetical protein
VPGAARPQLLAVDDEPVAGAAGRRPQAGEVGAGLGLGEPLAPDLAVKDRREVALPLLVGAGFEQRRGRVVDRHEGEDEAGGVVGRELLVQHDLLRDGHAAAPLRRPVGHGVAGATQLLEPVLLEGDEVLLGHAGLGVTPPGGHVSTAPGPHLGAEVVECLIGHRCALTRRARPARGGRGGR